MRTNRSSRVVWTILPIGILLAAPALRAQGNTGSIWGVVTDQQHLRVPAAYLTLQDMAGGLRRELTTSSEGSFEISGLPPGDYKLTAVAEGFQNAEFRVALEVNQRARLDIELAVGAQAEDVQVV